MLRNSMLLVAVIVASSGLLMAGENPKFVTGEVLLGYVETTVPPQMRFMGTQRISGRSEVQSWLPYSEEENVPVSPLIAGPITFVVNCNFDSNLRGPCWGTFEWHVPGVGTWEGTWTAPVMDLMTYESEISMVGHGMGGEIDGKQLKLDGGSAPGDFYIKATWRIK
jgi:hypothetical protein